MTRQIEVEHAEHCYRFLKETKKRVNLLYGGAGSAKSWSVAQFLLLEKMYKEQNIRILVTRKTRPALKKSAWLLVNDLIKKYDLPGCVPNKSDLTLTIGNNQMFFIPLDDPEKLKSIEKINYIWGEEATENTRDDYLQLGLRCRGENKNGINQLFFSFNPIDELGFLKAITDNPPDNTAVQHSTYKDNPFLDDDYIKEIENLQTQDLTYWKIYGQGIWASPENIIYKNWDIVDEFPEGCDKIGYGLDFGFNNPTALPIIGEKDQEIYIDETLYESGLTNTDLIERLKDLIKNKSDEIIADCAEPQRIEEIDSAGFNVFACIKGKGSVKIGIDRVKRKKLHITKRSTNIIKEIRGYKWREDRHGNVLDEPVPFRDHSMDAIRYYLGHGEDNEPQIRLI